MNRGTVVVLGSLPARNVPLADIVTEFGWSLEALENEHGLHGVNGRRQIVAVLFDPKALAGSALEDDSSSNGWSNLMDAVRRAAPGACIIACQKFSDPIPWPELVDQGAFHSLSLPLDASELRRSLGFVWAARRRHSVIQLDQAVRESERDGVQSSNNGSLGHQEPSPDMVVADAPASGLTERERDPKRQRGRAAESVA